MSRSKVTWLDRVCDGAFDALPVLTLLLLGLGS